MKTITIEMSQWAAGIAKLKDAYRVWSPVRENDYHVFKELNKDALPDLDFSNTRLSAKQAIYPQTQKMFEYTLDESRPDHHIMHEAPDTTGPQAVIGIRPCDAAAFLLVQKNFNTPQYKDPYWVKAYEKTTLVGLACNNPCSTCFCTSAGGGPFDEKGLDVLLVADKDQYLAKVLTDKGAKLLDAAGFKDEADAAGAQVTIDALREKADAAINSEIATDQLGAQETLTLYDAPFWEEVAFACINCGTCTYLCPTCWCFDIQDEVRGHNGVRMRNWDSCMFPLFTLHGSGHNPRDTKIHRVRQRFMHKLKYFVDKYDDGIQCTGCGRCVRACPVNIDIRNVCNQMNRFGTCPA